MALDPLALSAEIGYGYGYEGINTRRQIEGQAPQKDAQQDKPDAWTPALLLGTLLNLKEQIVARVTVMRRSLLYAGDIQRPGGVDTWVNSLRHRGLTRALGVGGIGLNCGDPYNNR